MFAVTRQHLRISIDCCMWRRKTSPARHSTARLVAMPTLWSVEYAGPKARHYFGSATERPSGPTVNGHAELDGLVEQQASANGVPASLVHRVILRESRYNPRAVNAGNYGLMQIRPGTARAMGYGRAPGLLDAETNMTYAVRYLAGAYRAAGGNEARAVALYARGY